MKVTFLQMTVRVFLSIMLGVGVSTIILMLGAILLYLVFEFFKLYLTGLVDTFPNPADAPWEVMSGAGLMGLLAYIATPFITALTYFVVVFTLIFISVFASIVVTTNKVIIDTLSGHQLKILGGLVSVLIVLCSELIFLEYPVPWLYSYVKEHRALEELLSFAMGLRVWNGGNNIWLLIIVTTASAIYSWDFGYSSGGSDSSRGQRG